MRLQCEKDAGGRLCQNQGKQRPCSLSRASNAWRRSSLDVSVEGSEGGVIFEQVGRLLHTACTQQVHVQHAIGFWVAKSVLSAATTQLYN